jgi:geranylgeranyl diphosphate synthase type 3
MDIYWRDSCQCPSEEDYKEMVLRSMLLLRVVARLTCAETGGLFSLAVKLMQLYSANTR